MGRKNEKGDPARGRTHGTGKSALNWDKQSWDTGKSALILKLALD